MAQRKLKKPAKKVVRKPAKLQILVGTRKGLLQLKPKGKTWEIVRQSFTGIPVQYSFYDDRTSTLWASLEHGHWGPKLHFSKNLGETWDEVPSPKYAEGLEIKPGKPAKLELVWYIAPGPKTNPNRLYFGTIPGGLFVSDDNGKTSELNRSLWEHPSRSEFWFGGGRNDAGLSSLFVDPRKPLRIIAGASCGGVFVSENGGESWEGRNKGLRGDFMPDPYAEFGHDPHFMTYCESNPDVLWQQNHCGIWRSEDCGKNWIEVSQKDGPARFGWAISADPKDEKTAWVVPAIGDVMRVAVGGALCVSRTEDGGKTWKALRKGLPQKNAFDIVFRHGLDFKSDSLAFGSTTGNLFYSSNRGDSWQSLGSHFPPIYSVRMMEG